MHIIDIKVTKDLVEMVNKKYPIETYRNYMKQLEVDTPKDLFYKPC